MICEAWEGLTVDGKFPLLERLHGGTDRCLFLTVLQGINTAGIRLVAAAEADQERYLAMWEAARRLTHPSLVQLTECGGSEVRGSHVVYVVMEKTDTFLSAVIPNKALTSTRAKTILEPIIGALSYIHEQGLTHGSVKPSNIVQVGEQWKLASDEMNGAGDSAKLTRELDTYDAPEVGSGRLTPAADVWSLGIIAIEAFAQKTPMWNRAVRGDLGVPDWMPEPFRTIARGCLRWEPQERLSIEKIKTLLEQPPAPETRVKQSGTETLEVKSQASAAAETEPVPPKEEPKPEPKREERKAVAPPSIVEADVDLDEEEDEEYEEEDEYEDEEEDELFQRPRRFSTLEGERKGVGWLIFLGVAVLVAVAAVMAVRGYWSEFWQSAKTQIAPQSSQPSPQSQAPPEGTASNQAAQQNPDQHPDQAAPQNQPQAPSPQTQDLTPGETPTQNQQPTEQQSAPASPQPSAETKIPASPPATPSEKQPAAAPETSEPKSEGKAPAPRVTNAKGAVTKRVLPSVASGARESMRRPVEVEVQVSVNERGGVSDATCLTQGAGNYFGRISVQAARSWKFDPPVSGGQPRPSSWILRFHFDRSHVEVTPTEMK